jgi:alanyl aminopeptidase
VDIRVRVAEATDIVWINSTQLELLDTRAEIGSPGRETLVAEVIPGNEDFVALKFAAPLPVGDARLSLSFRGTFNVDEVAGLFKQKDAGDWYALTQMEPMYARRAFPASTSRVFARRGASRSPSPRNCAFSNSGGQRAPRVPDGETRFQPSPAIASSRRVRRRS